ncbi:MAG: tRNA (adenosine(37)-N6)-dimethylallyltransferase MiaA [Helicobacteraceae bacterium]|jgi:tRNA dimethylallyltransferase|nr:tRNA (adenosine(37)-N6)-dimethylallyltransferase MiaA [Helicobacteraceae bacterium]
MKTLAIIGQSASGKSDLAHKIARATNAALLSMDSLSAYRQIDIASAKPAKVERADLSYFGLDIADPRDRFGADEFIAEFLRAKAFCEANNRNLIIVGGSGFYLAALVFGLSALPPISPEIKAETTHALENIETAYALLKTIDPIYANKIAPNDRYRIEKALLIALASGKTPSAWFSQNPPKQILQNAQITILSIAIETLRDRVKQRTDQMLENKLIAEIENLLEIAPRSAQPMKAIGVRETIDYIDGKITISELKDLINIHTAQFAKRQRTYNKGRFANAIALEANALETFAIDYLSDKNRRH